MLPHRVSRSLPGSPAPSLAIPLLALSLSAGWLGASAVPASGVALTADVQVNFKSGVCNCSNGRPVNQYNPSIAAWGPYVLASWYDLRFRCLPAGDYPTQSYGYSADYGATFKDAGLLYGAAGTVFAGDPSVTVNAKTGNFYIVGNRRATGQSPNGFLALKGHFEADTFKIDQRVTVAIADPGETYYLPWVVADSVSGNVHIVWWTSVGTESEIEYQRYDSALNPLGGTQVLASAGSYETAVQEPRAAVGPDGELYVAWTVYTSNFGGPLSSHEVVRSDDFGATFEPIQTASVFQALTLNPSPGSKHFYGLNDVGLAVDASPGPHRGRVYMVWDECVHYQDAPFGAHTAAFEAENNGTFATATPFVVGGKIRGTISAGDIDFYRFTASHGQTLVMRGDSVSSTGFIRVICSSSSDTSTLATYHTLGGSPGEGIVVGLPYDGTYTIQIDGTTSGPGSYTYATAFDTPSPDDHSLDQRDQVVSWSDDGVSWSTPARINDSAPGFDGTSPSVTVDDRGRVHAFWMDFRSDPGCGDLSDSYMASSGDGGVTWGANRRLSDASSYWGYFKSCSQFYNQGNYQHLVAAGDHLYAIFTDSRLGDPDVFMDASRHGSIASCPPGGVIPAGEEAALQFSLSNEGSFATPLAWQLVDSEGWLTGATPATSGSQSLSANGGTVVVTATLVPPSNCSGDSSIVSFITSDPYVPGFYDTCATTVHCSGTTAVSAGPVYPLSFGSPRPNPAHLRTHMGYTLSRTGPVRLEIFGANGARIRRLEAGVRSAGPHDLVWDGNDEAGRPVPPGAYFARLDAEGSTIRRAVMILR